MKKLDMREVWVDAICGMNSSGYSPKSLGEVLIPDGYAYLNIANVRQWSRVKLLTLDEKILSRLYCNLKDIIFISMSGDLDVNVAKAKLAVERIREDFEENGLLPAFTKARLKEEKKSKRKGDETINEYLQRARAH